MVIGIFGPTASGKTAVAEALAQLIPAEIVSADAMQVYRGLPILTNQSRAPARLVGIWDLGHEGSVAEYQQLAHEAIDDVIGAGKTPVVVGGTGLYLRAALAELELPPAPAPGVRQRIERLYDRIGPGSAHALLADRDPATAARVHANDRRRVVRALELTEAGASLTPAADTLWGGSYRRPTQVFGLDVPRERLAQRIEERTRRMFAAGVEAEVRAAWSGPLSQTARTIHGLREIAELPRDEAVETYNRRVRRYAAYQRKWMRRVPGIVIIDGDRPPEEVAAEILEVASARERLPPERGNRPDARGGP